MHASVENGSVYSLLMKMCVNIKSILFSNDLISRYVQDNTILD